MARLPEPVELAQLRAKLARAVRTAGEDHPTTVAVRREYEAARLAHVIAERLQPLAPLTTSELDTLTGLIVSFGAVDTRRSNGAIRRQANPDSVPLFDWDDDEGAGRQESPDSGSDAKEGV